MTLAEAQGDCAMSTWCGGVQKDSGMLCEDGQAKYEMRNPKVISAGPPAARRGAVAYVLQRPSGGGNIAQCIPSQANTTRGPKHRQGSVNNRFNLTNMTFWDPSPLPPSWWQPSRYRLKHKAGAAVARLSPHDVPACQSSRVFLKVSEFGRSNNLLVAWAHALELTVAHEPLATLVLTEQFEMGIARFFHWRAAVDGWACVVSHRAPLPPNATQIEISGADVFFLEQHASGHSTFYPHVIAQLLLRPIRPLRAAVETIIADYRGGYDGLHLRTLDRGPKACSAVWVTPEALRCQCVKSYNVTVDDICHMEPRYVRAALGVLGEPAANQSRPLLIAHDRSYDARVAELVHEFGGVDFGRSRPSNTNAAEFIWIDMLVLIFARRFIGNPGSTLAFNVDAVRRVLHPLGTSNMERCDSNVLPGAISHHQKARGVKDYPKEASQARHVNLDSGSKTTRASSAHRPATHRSSQSAAPHSHTTGTASTLRGLRDAFGRSLVEV